MTKLRPPISLELALTRVAGVIGWDRVAAACGAGESAVRKWTNPDTRPTVGGSVTLDQARILDREYHAAGGAGSPLLQCQALLLEAETLAATPNAAEVARAASNAAKESGEALAAAFTSAQPDAVEADFIVAERELEEAIAANTVLLGAVRQRRQAKQ